MTSNDAGPVASPAAASSPVARAVIASGSGRYADPWHPYARTSHLLSELLKEGGFDVRIEEDLDDAMTRLDDASLLVVNAGDPWRNAERAEVPQPAVRGFREALARGIGVLALHTAPATMRDYPEWANTVGAIWLPQISMHPPADETVIQLRRSHLGEAGSFRVFDERYCRLQPVGESTVIATHTADGIIYPTAWTRIVDASRVAVDVLGHDERSYQSEGHRHLLLALAQWAASTVR